MRVGETGVGKMGVGETGQIIGETGVGKTGVGEMGVIRLICIYIIALIVHFKYYGSLIMNTI